MEQGYDDHRFEKPVDENLHCVICTEVLKDPVQCRRNEHHFCRSCITRYLQHSQNCPTCKDPLTVETLRRPTRFLANTQSNLTISCENFERGCRQVVELGSLNTHVASCGFSPVPCSNDRCEEIVNRRDKETHENKVCGFRRIKCDYCSEVVLYMNLMQHICPARKEMAEIKAELTEIRSTQNKMFKMMQNVMSNLMRTERNMPQCSEACCVSSAQDLQAEVIVAGSTNHKSVEVFNMTTKTWRSLSELNQYRNGAHSVLYQGHMFVTGGYYSFQYLDTVEELNLAQKDGHWVQSQFQLPVPSRGHVCVVYQNRLFVIGGYAGLPYNSIHEIQLTPPYTSRLLTKIPQPICYHGAEILNDKVYIIGGTTTGWFTGATNTVLMFDPACNTCTELKPLPYPVSYTATVTWKDNVIVLGGMDEEGNALNTVIFYNVTTGSHRMLPDMRKKRYGCTAVIVGDNIIVMGGRDETLTNLDSVQCYNFDTNTWKEFPAMTKRRGYPTAVVKYC